MKWALLTAESSMVLRVASREQCTGEPELSSLKTQQGWAGEHEQGRFLRLVM